MLESSLDMAAKLGIAGVGPENFPTFSSGAVGTVLYGISPGNYSRTIAEEITFQDNVTKIMGRHTIKFGYEVIRTRENVIDEVLPSGNYVFGTGGTGLLYDPDRLKKPLIRRGERGEQRFDEVSWETALDHVAEQMTQIRQKYGPEALALCAELSAADRSLGVGLFALAEITGDTSFRPAVQYQRAPVRSAPESVAIAAAIATARDPNRSRSRGESSVSRASARSARAAATWIARFVRQRIHETSESFIPIWNAPSANSPAATGSYPAITWFMSWAAKM